MQDVDFRQKLINCPTRQLIRFIKLFGLVFLAIVLLSACKTPTEPLGLGVTLQDPETSQVHQPDIIARLPGDESQWVGQTFENRRNSLNSITVYVEVTGGQEAALTAAISNSHTGQNQLIYTQYARSGPVTFSFEDNFPPGIYTFTLKARGPDVLIKGKLDDFYPFGNAITGSQSQPISGDLAFATSYQYTSSEFWLDFKTFISNAWLFFPLAATLLLPGAVLISLTKWQMNLDVGEWLGISTGLSLSILPILMLWSGISRLQWTQATSLVFSLVLVVVWIVQHSKQPLRHFRQWDKLDFGFLVVFLGALILRLMMVRDMAGPAWVDGIQHGIITRTIMEQGWIPNSYAPLMDTAATDYHPGFHIGLASFLWLSKLNIMTGMLIYGQILNALAIPAVYVFTKRMINSRPAALAAALFCAFCSPMPAYYTSWARYPQLAGLVVLPVVLLGFQNFIQTETIASNLSPKDRFTLAFRRLIPVWVASSGLILIHYRVAAFCALLMLCWTGLKSWQDQSEYLNWKSMGRSILIPVFLSAAMTLPWLLSVITNTLAKKQNTTANLAWFNDFSWGYITAGLGEMVLILAVLGLLFGFIERKRFVLVITAWIACLVLLANPEQIGLPLIVSNNTTMEITLFIPICALAGYFIHLTTSASARLGWKWFSHSLMPTAIILALLGTQKLAPILNEGTMLIRQSDLKGLSWAAQNLPPGAYVATNPFLWGYSSYAGADGGYWLGPASGIRSFPPPVAAYTNAQIFHDAQTLGREMEKFANQPDELARIFRQEGFTHIFLGQRGGILSPRLLTENQNFRLLYHLESVWIFYLKP